MKNEKSNTEKKYTCECCGEYDESVDDTKLCFACRCDEDNRTSCQDDFD